MRHLRAVIPAALLLALVAVPSTAAAKKNPYTATEVCGPGYRVIDRHALYDDDSGTERPVHLADIVLTYNSRTGYNCAVTLKRYRVGKAVKRGVGDWLYVSLAARPLSNETVGGDSGNFKYYAGPVRVPARDRCVQWQGGATALVPANWEPRGYFNSSWKSRWGHCG